MGSSVLRRFSILSIREEGLSSPKSDMSNKRRTLSAVDSSNVSRSRALRRSYLFVVGGGGQKPHHTRCGGAAQHSHSMVVPVVVVGNVAFIEMCLHYSKQCSRLESQNSGSLRVGVRTACVILTGDGDVCRRERLPRADMLRIAVFFVFVNK